MRDARCGTPDAGRGLSTGCDARGSGEPDHGAGSETPVDLNGREGRGAGGEDLQEREVLGELKGNRFMAGMQSMRANLARSAMCHLVKQKTSADPRRRSGGAGDIRMNEEINRRRLLAK